MNHRHYLKLWRGLLFSLLLLGAAVTFTSCGDDEPSGTTIDYYLDVEEEFLINGSTGHTDRYENPITRMRAAIRKAYPTPDANGNDEAVLEACDKEFETYVENYSGGAEHFTCLFHLVRATKQGAKVVQTEELRTYSYDINPIIPDDGGDDDE